MATTPYPLSAAWSAANRYTASGDTDIILSNTASSWLTWTLTTSDTAPTISPNEAHPVAPMTSRAMTLHDGERLWMAGDGARAALGV